MKDTRAAPIAGENAEQKEMQATRLLFPDKASHAIP